MTLFISYGDDRFKESLNRIARQARKIGIFDRIIKYSPKDLPEFIKASPLFAFDRGGGYWVWKPYIVYQTLNLCQEGDILVYADAGCTLSKDSPEWEYYLNLLHTHSAIFFQYRENYDYGWKCVRKPCGDAVALKHWMKPSLVQFYERSLGLNYLDSSKILGGFFIIKKNRKDLRTIDEWYKITLFHPELVMDPSNDDIADCPPDFFEHRHDQAVLSPLVYHFQSEDDLVILPETAESKIGHPAVIADRWRQGKSSILWKMKYLLWSLLQKYLKTLLISLL
jgi:hypothetical protein